MKKNKVTKLEDLYKKIHAEIRKNPERVKSTRPKDKRLTKEEKAKRIDSKNMHKGIGGKSYRRDRKISLKARKKRVTDKINAFAKQRKHR